MRSGRRSCPRSLATAAPRMRWTARQPMPRVSIAFMFSKANRVMRFLFYSHDGLGLGHTRRHLTVAAALAQQAPDAAILLATGAEEPGRFGLPRQVEILKLPGLRKDANEKYSARRLKVSVNEIRALRSA